MSSKKEQLIEEIRSITQQYREEIKGRRKPWPKSIKDRVLALSKLGIPQKELSQITGIGYVTILEWRKQAGQLVKGYKRTNKFRSLSVAPTTVVDTTVEPSTVGVEQSTVRLTTTDGFRLEFYDAVSAAEFIKAVRGAL